MVKTLLCKLLGILINLCLRLRNAGVDSKEIPSISLLMLLVISFRIPAIKK